MRTPRVHANAVPRSHALPPPAHSRPLARTPPTRTRHHFPPRPIPPTPRSACRLSCHTQSRLMLEPSPREEVHAPYATTASLSHLRARRRTLAAAPTTTRTTRTHSCPLAPIVSAPTHRRRDAHQARLRCRRARCGSAATRSSSRAGAATEGNVLVPKIAPWPHARRRLGIDGPEVLVRHLTVCARQRESRSSGVALLRAYISSQRIVRKMSDQRGSPDQFLSFGTAWKCDWLSAPETTSSEAWARGFSQTTASLGFCSWNVRGVP